MKQSEPFRGAFGHTPLSVEEKIPWDCRRLVIGTGGDGALAVMDEVEREADHRKVDLLIRGPASGRPSARPFELSEGGPQRPRTWCNP
jgi:hypothetical protein